MSDWLTYSQTTGSGNTNITITASSGNVTREQVIKVYNQNTSINVRLRQFVITSEWLTAVFDIPSPGSYYLGGGNISKSVIRYRVDGGAWIGNQNDALPPAIYYTFSTSGKHIVEYDTYEYGATSCELPRETGDETTCVPYGMFMNTDNSLYITDVYIPAKYTRILVGCFWGNSRIEHIYMTNSIEIMDTGFLYQAKGISSITVSDNLIGIPSDFAADAQNLATVNISSSCSATYIGDHAFYDTSISSITIPENVTTIYNYAFGENSDLTTIYAYPTTAPTLLNTDWQPDPSNPCRDHSVHKYPFFNVGRNGTLHYPAGSNYSSWLQNTEGYLGYYGWTGVADL